ncbi:hypothetical protein AXF42_Ash014779 [Apostasia shenzhenica]|uniref:Glycine cleavage system H protein 2, mitochondrial n=1 Tax=Apostasia shenzhenica TaxID=1088818 RepID=A0A2H9ZWD3_9ASPA|nr:hypothetical protein AXF42_Ash014779 [Apostasia shenzhenica]
MALKLWASSAANTLKLSSAISGGRSFPFSRCFSSVLDGLKYSSSHEWIKHEDSLATVGITDHAQAHLGEVVYVELPEIRQPGDKRRQLSTVESVEGDERCAARRSPGSCGGQHEAHRNSWAGSYQQFYRKFNIFVT